jgi:chromosomal replication initiation ATPase DnaA
MKPEIIEVLVALGIDVDWAKKVLLGKRTLAEATKYHGVVMRTLLGSKARQVSEMRFTAMAAMREAGLTLAEIAHIFQMSDHSSVCYGLRVVQADQRLMAQASDLLNLATGLKQREAA